MTLHHPWGSRLEDRIVVRPSFAFSVTLLGISCRALLSFPFLFTTLSFFHYLLPLVFGFLLYCGGSRALWGPFFGILAFFGFFINCEFGGLISLKVAFV